jgi:hypothetical protein
MDVDIDESRGEITAMAFYDVIAGVHVGGKAHNFPVLDLKGTLLDPVGENQFKIMKYHPCTSFSYSVLKASSPLL